MSCSQAELLTICKDDGYEMAGGGVDMVTWEMFIWEWIEWVGIYMSDKREGAVNGPFMMNKLQVVKISSVNF